ncbi:hypothetical protein K2X89_10420, partial [Myxococcota bacterium]|nr:hypothetical protein [Myxococcota bacterium]
VIREQTTGRTDVVTTYTLQTDAQKPGWRVTSKRGTEILSDAWIDFGGRTGYVRAALNAGVPIVPVVFRNALDAFPKDAAIVRQATVEAVVLPPIPTRDWTPEGLDEEIEAIRRRYMEILRPE